MSMSWATASLEESMARVPLPVVSVLVALVLGLGPLGANARANDEGQ